MVVYSNVLWGTLIWSIGAFYALTAFVGLFFTFLRHPFRTFRRSKRNYPKILKKPEYGEHKMIDVNGVQLHYVEKGDPTNPLMLFIHGFPEFWFSWKNQIEEFSTDYWTVAFDMRGYGESSKPRGVSNYSMKVLIKDVKELIEALGKDKCILVAHDWGGAVAHTFIRKHPDMVEKYILMNTVYVKEWRKAIFGNLKQFISSWYVFLFNLPYIPEFYLRTGDCGAFNQLFNKYLTKEEIEAYKYNFRKFGYVTAPLNYYRSILYSTYEVKADRLNELNVPGLYLHGKNDNAITLDVAFARSFYDIKNVKFVKIEEADHFVQISAPKEVNLQMRKFLKQSE